MTGNKTLFKSLGSSDGLVVTRRHALWLERPDHERIYTKKAATFVADALLGKFQHERHSRVSPSSVLSCERRAQLAHDGAPRDGENLDSYDIMGLGTWGHLRWQAEGLSAGYMKECEKWVYDPEYRCGGSIDAILDDGSLFELKTVGGSKYRKVTDLGVPYPEHAAQVELYLVLSGATLASIVYEHRDTGQFTEMRYRSDPRMKDEALQWLGRVLEGIDGGVYVDQLDSCELRQGQTYRNCSFRTECTRLARLGR